MRLNYTIIGWFIFLHLGALLSLVTYSHSALVLMLVMYWLTASIGICFGFHRYLTHKGMSVPKWLDYSIVFLGTLACQNGPIKWVGHHRQHHQFSDTENDPHNANRGFWWSHIGWMLYTQDSDDTKTIERYTRDINQDKFYQFLDRYFILVQIALGILFYIMGGLSWVVWGIFVRLVLVYHATWLVNSACHMWGYKNFKIDKDLSTNNWWTALLTFGEGWHNNHHKYPKVAKHGGSKFFEVDLTYLSIYILSKLRLVTNITQGRKDENSVQIQR